MRIAIVGGDATGKTTLAKHAAEQSRVPLLESLRAEVLAQSGYHTIFEWDAATQGLTGLIDKQAERERTQSAGIIDGGVLDIYALIQRWAWHRLSPVRAERLQEVVAEAAKRYDRVVITPPRVVAAPASGRFRSLEHNRQLTRLLAASARDFGITHAFITDASEDERKRECIRVCT